MLRLTSLVETHMTTPDPHDAAVAEVCYRHPDRSSGVSCQRCDRLICPECMNQASVGVHCPECTQSKKQQVYTASNLPGSRGLVTRVLIGINVTLWVLTIVAFGATVGSAGDVGARFGTWGPAIDFDGEVWRVISGGFLHSGLIHIGFNMYLLWQLGQQLERVLGERRFISLYMISLIGGSFGALILNPQVPVVGASGAVFGLIGATVLMYRSRGIGLFDTGLGFLIVMNALYSLRGGVSLGGHLGGFITGLLIGAVFFGVESTSGPVFGTDKKKVAGALLVLAVMLFAGAIWAASTWMNPIF